MFKQTSGRHLKRYTAASRAKLSARRAVGKVKNMLSTKPEELRLDCMSQNGFRCQALPCVYLNKYPNPHCDPPPHPPLPRPALSQRNVSREILFENEEVVYKEAPLILIERAFLWYWPPLLWPWPWRQALSCQWAGHSLPYTACLPRPDPPLTPSETIAPIRQEGLNVCPRVNFCRSHKTSKLIQRGLETQQVSFFHPPPPCLWSNQSLTSAGLFLLWEATLHHRSKGHI